MGIIIYQSFVCVINLLLHLGCNVGNARNRKDVSLVDESKVINDNSTRRVATDRIEY